MAAPYPRKEPKMNSKARALISQARALSAARKPAQGALKISIRKARGEGGQYLVGADLEDRKSVV